MPAAPLRRPVTITTWIVLSAVCLILSPLLLALGAAVSALTRRPQALLLARLLISYFAHELGVLLACGALWVASGAGTAIRSPRFQRLHYRLLGWFVGGLTERAVSLLGIELAGEGEDEATRALAQPGPILFFSRHAGPGDTMLLVHLLLNHYGRRPSVVFKEALAIDPSVDLIGHRLPHAVLDTDDREECQRIIAQTASQLGDRGVLLLFPEGANFTPERRRGALHKLWSKGRRREAAEAHEMPHVLPPHPTGALAALAGNPSADVIFAAHTGLGLAAFPRQLWRQAPFGKTFRTRMWLVGSGEVPHDPEAQARWIYDWWKRIDDWIDRCGEESRTGTAGNA
jgi:1-acyl-sn-glycerol-3-phosphate acyltransferase